MKEEIASFLALLDENAAPNDINGLVRALDDLVIAYNRSDDVADDEEYQTPPTNYTALSAAAARAFPDLGWYPVVDPRETIEQDPSLADAIDDIADIANDLSEVLWRLENTSIEDAIWYFRFSYETHWGDHLHQLRVYLHAKLYR